VKLSDLRPCDACSGPLGLSFNVVRHSGALAGGKATQEVAGLTVVLGSEDFPEHELLNAAIAATCANKGISHGKP